MNSDGLFDVLGLALVAIPINQILSVFKRMNYDLFLQQRGGTPNKVEDWSHYNDPIPKDGQPHGNSRRHGDASPAVQAQVIETIIQECVKQGLSKEDTAHVLAIARVESGFNPDAAAGTSSASGVGQFIEKTGQGYGLNDQNRFDLKENVRALVDHYQDNKELALARGKDAAHVYKYHHDGPSLNSGGLGLAHKEVLPYAKAYLSSPVLADLASRPRDTLAEPGTILAQATSVRQAGAASPADRLASTTSSSTSNSSAFSDIAAFKVNKLTVAVESPAATGHLPYQDARSSRRSESVGEAASSGSTIPSAGPAKETSSAVRDSNVEGMAQARTSGLELDSGSRGPVIPLSDALASHMQEKGFDAASVSQASVLALHLLEGSILKDTDASALVLHKEGGALASLVGAEDARHFEKAGDSVLTLDKLEQVAHHGLDTDAVASIRGLAPVQTNPFSDLEVHQAASPELYARAQDPGAPINSPGVAQDLVAALSSADRFSSVELRDAQHSKGAESHQSAGMAMDA